MTTERSGIERDMIGQSRKEGRNFPAIDAHTHLLPSVDDGVESYAEALAILETMRENGVRHVCVTPHVKNNRYPNTPETIGPAFEHLSGLVRDARIDIELHCAAEYHLDYHFTAMLDAGEELMAFGCGYVLVECPQEQKMLILPELLFRLREAGYKPVLAHPERYTCYPCDAEVYRTIREWGCLFQMNLLSPIGYYGSDAARKSKMLLRNGLIDLSGSDIHSLSQLPLLYSRKTWKAVSGYEFKNEMCF